MCILLRPRSAGLPHQRAPCGASGVLRRMGATGLTHRFPALAGTMRPQPRRGQLVDQMPTAADASIASVFNVRSVARAGRPYSRSRMRAAATTLTRASSPRSASASTCTAGSDSAASLARTSAGRPGRPPGLPVWPGKNWPVGVRSDTQQADHSRREHQAAQERVAQAQVSLREQQARLRPLKT